jgi:hypothetical protein
MNIAPCAAKGGPVQDEVLCWVGEGDPVYCGREVDPLSFVWPDSVESHRKRKVPGAAITVFSASSSTPARTPPPITAVICGWAQAILRPRGAERTLDNPSRAVHNPAGPWVYQEAPAALGDGMVGARPPEPEPVSSFRLRLLLQQLGTRNDVIAASRNMAVGGSSGPDGSDGRVWAVGMAALEPPPRVTGSHSGPGSARTTSQSFAWPPPPPSALPLPETLPSPLLCLALPRPVQQVACGAFHCLLALRGGGCFSFGRGAFGELGGGRRETWRARPAPVHLPGSCTQNDSHQHHQHSGSVIRAVAAGTHVSVLVSEPEGYVWTFGSGAYCRLGHPPSPQKTELSEPSAAPFDGLPTDQLLPTLVEGLVGVGALCGQYTYDKTNNTLT